MTCTDTCLDWEPKIQISHNCQWLFSNFMTHFLVSKEEKHKQCNRYQRIKLLTLGYLMLVYGSVPQFILGILSNQTVECTATHKQWCALHHLRHRMPCLQTAHIHHSFCFMTAFQLPYSLLSLTHTPPAYHKPLKYSRSHLSPNSCSKLVQRDADKLVPFTTNFTQGLLKDTGNHQRAPFIQVTE